jgi:branched-chain amino acid aminotransferase
MPTSTIHNGQTRILKNLLPKHKRKTPPTLNDELQFGRVRTDHMLVCDYLPSKGGWQTPEIVPFGPFEIPPDSLVLHYGQEIFEGMKAYRSGAGANNLFLFRPEKNAERFYNSAVRLGMQPVPPQLFVQCIKELVTVERDWILPTPGSLYIRPVLIAWDTGVSYRASQSYRFFILVFPVKNYYAKETGVTVYIEKENVRATRGGVGESKCGGNYAGALLPLEKAKKLGAEQVLWLDALEHTYVEEVGAMNVMFVYNQRIVTPPLSGSILPGVTRDSVLQLARSLGFEVEERPVSIHQILADAKSGALTEVFGCGTAAVISPIDAFVDDLGTYPISEKRVGPVTLQLKESLMKIQTGIGPDIFGWRCEVESQ